MGGPSEHDPADPHHDNEQQRSSHLCHLSPPQADPLPALHRSVPRCRPAAKSELGQRIPISLADAQAIMERWPEAPKKAAEKILDHYGRRTKPRRPRCFCTASRTGPARELTADEVVHNFPTPTHRLTQYLDYRVPANKANELVEFDGSVIIGRTAGQVAATVRSRGLQHADAQPRCGDHRRKTRGREVLLRRDRRGRSPLGRSAPYAEGCCSRRHQSRPVTPTRGSSAST